MRIVTDLFAWAGAELPEWNTISISGYHIREAGSTAIQEVAFTLANAIAYIEAALRAGLKVDAFAPRLSFFFNAHSDFLEEIAKYRAARRLYAHIMKERFGAQDPEVDDDAISHPDRRFDADGAAARCQRGARGARGHVRRAGRHAIAAHQLARRGAGAAHRGFRAGWRCARSRSSLTRAGSPRSPIRWAEAIYIEELTDKIERGAQDYLDRIDALGGTLAAIEKGWIQAEIQNAAYEFQQQVERGEKIVVGVNRFQQEDEHAADGFAHRFR